MSRSREPWGDALRSVGFAVADLFKAEVDQLGQDLRTSRQKVTRLALLGVAAAFLGFWLLAVLLYAAVEAAALWLPRWGAALLVAGVLLLAVIVLGLLIRSGLRRLDNPVQTVKRRVASHVGWWNETIGASERDGALPGRADRYEASRREDG